MKLNSSTIEFLSTLAKNNNREWFNENKTRYQEAQQNIKSFANDTLDLMNEWDEIEKVKIFRIYRDVRFSKDKTPYKTNLGTSFVRATNQRRGGYYFHVQPGNMFAAGGFWQPSSDDLKRIRQELAIDIDEIEEIQNDKNFKEHFGSITGERLKSSPRGYAKDHEHIEWLRLKQFLMVENFTDKEVLSKDFSNRLNATFKAMLPLHNYMSEVLTTDINGVPLI